MSDDYETAVRRRLAEQERGSWRETLRADFAPWLDDILWGFDCGDGWQAIVRALLEDIARLIGGPDRYPGLRVTTVKQKHGTLRVYLLATPREHSRAIDAAIARAEAKSTCTCETCGKPGRLRQSRGGWWHTACRRHAL